MLKKLQLTFLFIMVISLTIFFFISKTRSDHIISAYIAEGISQAAPIKIRIAEYYAKYGTFPDSNSGVNLPPPSDLNGRSVQSIEVSMAGRITITFNHKVKQHSSIILIPDDTNSYISSAHDWSCVSSSIKQKYFDEILLDCSYQEPTQTHALIAAIQQNNYEAFTEILAKDVDVNGNAFGYTPLMSATKQGVASYIDKLVKSGADINGKSSNFHGMTPLMYAARIGQIHAARKIISLHADINAQDENGMTALMHATQHSHHKLVELLLNHGSDWRLRDANGRSALDHYAKIHKDSLGYKLLAKYAGEAFSETTKAGSTHHSLTITSNEFSKAAQKGDREHVLKLIKSGIDINQRDIKGATALHYAVQANQKEIVSTLISQGANTNIQSTELETPLILAIKNNNTEIARDLVLQGANDQARGRLNITPLMLAAKLGQDEIAEMILKSGTATANSRYSALYEALTNAATRKPRIEIQRLLIQSGLDLNQHKANQIPFLILAAQAGNPTMVEAMLKRGANPNIKSQTNETALLSAAEHGFTGIATMLLNAGADKNAANNEGRTALILAVKNKHYRMVSLLLDVGVDMNATDNNGMTAFSIARALYYDNILSLLRRHRNKR